MATVPLSPSGIDGEVGTRPLLTPNESPKKKDTTERTPEDDIVRMALRLHAASKKWRSKFDSKWAGYWDFYRGDQWPVKRPSNKASPNCNIIASTVNVILPILTDTSPSFGVLARDPADFKFADLMTSVLKSWWNRRSMNHIIVESLMDCLVTDVGLLKIVWNEDLDDGLGDVEVTVVDPFRIYVPSGANDFDRNCRWVIHEFFKSRGSLALKFPRKAKILEDASSYTKSDADSTDEDTRIRVVSPTDKDVEAPDNADSSKDGKSPNDDIRVWELWMEDDTVVEEEQINEGSEPTKVLKKKWPHGRVITLLPDSKEVLQDVDNPYRDGQFPFVRIVDMLNPRCFYGMGEVAGLSETQRMINKSFSVIMDWCNLMSNPSWVVDDDSGVDPSMLTNQVGQVIMKKRDTTVQRQDAPGVPPQLFEMYHTLMNLADTQSGVHEVTQGRKPTGISAAQAIETLQEAAQTRIRLKERNLMQSLVRLGMLVISRMLQYYTEPRVIRLTGRDEMKGTWPSYIRFFVEQTGEDEYTPNTQTIEYDEGTEGYVERPAEQGTPSMGDFELEVTTGTSLPFIKQQRGEQAMRMWENKAIDRQALLDVIEWPDKDQLLQRMEQAEAAAAEQQPQPGAPPAPPM